MGGDGHAVRDVADDVQLLKKAQNKNNKSLNPMQIPSIKK
jgi:hypothetical protein